MDCGVFFDPALGMAADGVMYSFFFLDIQYGYCFSQPSCWASLYSAAAKPRSSPSFTHRYSFSVLSFTRTWAACTENSRKPLKMPDFGAP